LCVCLWVCVHAYMHAYMHLSVYDIAGKEDYCNNVVEKVLSTHIVCLSGRIRFGHCFDVRFWKPAAIEAYPHLPPWG
jgi:hypothetical protein